MNGQGDLAKDVARFEAAIRDDPYSETPKLVFADWLEERQRQIPCRNCAGSGEVVVATSEISFLGGGWASKKCDPCDGSGEVSNHFDDRAKFIRGQVLNEPDIGGHFMAFWELHERPKLARDGYAGHFGYAGMAGGFPSQPLTSYSAWFGGTTPCPSCRAPGDPSARHTLPCEYCGGVGELAMAQAGPELVKRYPVQTVHFSDKAPARNYDGWFWAAHGARDRFFIPSVNGGPDSGGIEFPQDSCRIEPALMQITGVAGVGSQVSGAWPGGPWDRVAFGNRTDAVQSLAVAAIIWACERIFEEGGPDTPEFRWKLTGPQWRRNRGAYREWRKAELQDAARDRYYQRQRQALGREYEQRPGPGYA